MKSFIIILSCLSAVAFANPREEVLQYFVNGQRTCRVNCQRLNPGSNPLVACPPTNCPPAVRDGFCGAPDCSIEANQRVHHPHPDPNFFWQCAPLDAWGRWHAVQMPCGCKTFFFSLANRCVHRDEWQKDCPNQPDFPIFADCPIDCPGDCNGNGPVTQPPVTSVLPVTQPPVTTVLPVTEAPVTTPVITVNPPPVTTPAPTPTPPNGCQCPCVPCVWWPCQPCLANCACGNNQNQQQNNPWQRPG